MAKNTGLIDAIVEHLNKVYTLSIVVRYLYLDAFLSTLCEYRNISKEIDLYIDTVVKNGIAVLSIKNNKLEDLKPFDVELQQFYKYAESLYDINNDDINSIMSIFFKID